MNDSPTMSGYRVRGWMVLLFTACAPAPSPEAPSPEAPERKASDEPTAHAEQVATDTQASSPSKTSPPAPVNPSAGEPSSEQPTSNAESSQTETTPAEPPDPTPVLQDADGTALPQTEDKPVTDSAAFRAGAERLFRAIVDDDAELALPFFFPVVAYEQVKAIEKPARDWETRLVRLFKRDIHEYHRRLGKYRDQCKFLRIEVSEPGIKWMKPGSEGNRIGYFRVLRSILYYEDHAGKERQLGITSFISWRGEWYVVHLNGFS